jgi:hypothetical protein
MTTSRSDTPIELAAAVLQRTSRRHADELLVSWGHRLGPYRRLFGQQAYVLCVDREPVSIAVSASVISPTVAGYRRDQVVELARLCSAPGRSWASRVMLRLWREVAAPRWRYWPVQAAVSYSLNAQHRGHLYRHDGWERVTDRAGSRGGGTWSTRRDAGDPAFGSKTLWIWRYRDPDALTSLSVLPGEPGDVGEVAGELQAA